MNININLKPSDDYIASADYHKQGSNELALKKGEKVEVIEKTEHGWWLIKKSNEDGWVPSSYLDPLDPKQAKFLLRSFPSKKGNKYTCVSSYKAELPDELSISQGEVVEVIEKNLDGWWLLKYKGNTGLFPSVYLTHSLHLKIQNLKNTNLKEKCSSTVEIVSDAFSATRQLRTNKIQHDSHTSVGVPTAQLIELGISETAEDDDDVTENSRLLIPYDYNAEKEKKNSCITEPPPRRKNVKVIKKPSVRPPRPPPPKIPSKYLTVDDFHGGLADGLSFKKNQEVTVISKSDTGWWYVTIGEQTGWVSSLYLKASTQKPVKRIHSEREIKGNSPARPLLRSTTFSTSECQDSVLSNHKNAMAKKRMEFLHNYNLKPSLMENNVSSYRSIYDFDAESPSELSLHTGDLVTVTDTSKSGWWFVKTDNGKEGWVPQSHLELVID